MDWIDQGWILELVYSGHHGLLCGDGGDSGDRVRDSSWNSHGLTCNNIDGLDKPRMDA